MGQKHWKELVFIWYLFVENVFFQDMRVAFDSQEVSRLQEVAEKMDREVFTYHLQRCIDSGLWIPDANSVKEESVNKNQDSWNDICFGMLLSFYCSAILFLHSSQKGTVTRRMACSAGAFFGIIAYHFFLLLFIGKLNWKMSLFFWKVYTMTQENCLFVAVQSMLHKSRLLWFSFVITTRVFSANTSVVPCRLCLFQRILNNLRDTFIFIDYLTLCLCTNTNGDILWRQFIFPCVKSVIIKAHSQHSILNLHKSEIIWSCPNPVFFQLYTETWINLIWVQKSNSVIWLDEECFWLQLYRHHCYIF